MRDFRYIVPFMVQFGLFVSPIAFSTADVPAQWRAALRAQPAGRDHRRFPLVAARRARGDLDPQTHRVSLAVTAAVLALGWHLVFPPHGTWLRRPHMTVRFEKPASELPRCGGDWRGACAANLRLVAWRL